MSAEPPVVAGVELGGTKTIAVVGRGRTILDRVTVATTTPDATLRAVAATLARWRHAHRPAALGIASFGPVGLRPGAPNFGHILTTPKLGWEDVDVLDALGSALPGPCAIHTDVTAAALGEGRWGAARECTDFAYVTIGTGIGVGIVVDGRPLTGELHPEAGHLRVRRVAGDKFVGVCPFHGDCLEGLASGPAIAARAGNAAIELALGDPVWAIVADAIAEAFASLALTIAPAAIVVGGGVGVGQPHLLALVRPLMVDKLRGYLPFVTADSIATMVVPAALGGDAGPLGALVLAEHALASA